MSEEALSLDDMLKQLQIKTRNNMVSRDALITKVMDCVNKLEFKLDDDSGARTEAKLAVIKLADELMNSAEGSVNRVVAAELRRATIDIEKDNGAKIVEALRHIGHTPITTGEPTNLSDQDLANAFAAGNCEELKEGETSL